MELADYLRILRKGWALVVAAVLVCIGAAAGISALTPPTYQADTQLFISMQGGEDAGALLQGSSFTQQRVKSYADVVRSPLVLEPVVEELGLDVSPRQLAAQVRASAPMDTVLLDVVVQDESPEAAARIANAIAKRFQSAVRELERPEGGDTSPVRVSVIKEAVVPSGAVTPRTKVNLALGVLVGLAVGMGIAVLREVLDTTVKSTETISALGVPVLGATILAEPQGGRPQLVTEPTNTPQAEALRQIRTSLQFADVDHPPRVVIVTSSLPGDGKSTTAANLALTVAMAGVRTILVEADLRLPKVSDYLGLDRSAGLTTVLAGRADIDDVLQPYGDTELLVLPAGAVPMNPAALLGSRHMADLVDRLRERSELVIIDSPPLLPVADAAVLSRHADGAVLVVRHGRTTRDHLTKALDRLHAVDARVLGGVLSMVPARGSDYGYSYSYTYDYGYQPEVAAEAGTLAER